MFAKPGPSRSSGTRRGGPASDSVGHSAGHPEPRTEDTPDRAVAAQPDTRDEPWLSDREQQVWRSFLELTGTLTEHLDRELRRDAGIPHTYYQVLAMLSEAPGRALRMSDLAAAAWASPSRMSHAVDRLQEAGWVERRPAPGDGRGQIAVLTEAGHRKLAEAAPDHARTVRAILFDPLGPELLDAFAEICRSALQQLADRDATCRIATT